MKFKGMPFTNIRKLIWTDNLESTPKAEANMFALMETRR